MHRGSTDRGPAIKVWAFATVSYVNGELFQATARRASELGKELVAQDPGNHGWLGRGGPLVWLNTPSSWRQ